MKNWTERDLEDLDAKFDALCEYFGLQFVFERISDGSDVADRERVYIRKKAGQITTQQLPMTAPLESYGKKYKEK